MTPERPDTEELVAIAEAFEWNYARAHAALANPDSWTDDLRSLCATARELRGLTPASWRAALMPEVGGSKAASGTEDSRIIIRRPLSTRIRGILRPLTVTCLTAVAALLLQWSVSDISYTSTMFVAGAFFAGVAVHFGIWHDAIKGLRA